MSIGDGPDIEQFNREEDKRVKLGDEVNTWWRSLDDNRKFVLLETYYDIETDISLLDARWEDLSWDDQLDIYKEANGFGERVRV